MSSEEFDRKLERAMWFIGGILVGTLITAFIVIPLG